MVDCCCQCWHLWRRPRPEKKPLLAGNSQKLRSDSAQYVLKEVIGSGTTAICYLCTRQIRGPDIHKDEDLACKVVEKRKLGIDRNMRGMLLEQLRNEIEILQRLDHPNVIGLIDVFETEQKVFIVTELMRGGELFDRIVAKGRLSEREAAHIIRQVASGLAHCHEQGVVHRDLKPENLLLQIDDTSPIGGSGLDDGNDEIFKVKIADFGFSRTLQESCNTMSYIGTAGYLSPELRQGKAYTKVVDVWALGVITYVLLSGHLPFAPDTSPIIQGGMPVENFALAFPAREWEGISDDAKELIWSMLQVDPLLRCTAAHVRDHRWVNGRSKSYKQKGLGSVKELAKMPKRFQSFFIEPHQKTQCDVFGVEKDSGGKKKVSKKRADQALASSTNGWHPRAKRDALKARASFDKGVQKTLPDKKPPMHTGNKAARAGGKSPALHAWQLSEDPANSSAAIRSLDRGYQSDETHE